MAMTLRMTDEETEALRKQAALEGRSMQALVHDAIHEYLERDAHRTRVAAVSALAAKRYRDVLRRLGEA